MKFKTWPVLFQQTSQKLVVEPVKNYFYNQTARTKPTFHVERPRAFAFRPLIRRSNPIKANSLSAIGTCSGNSDPWKEPSGSLEGPSCAISARGLLTPLVAVGLLLSVRTSSTAPYYWLIAGVITTV